MGISFMTDENRKVLRALIRMAGGDSLLVERACRQYDEAGNRPTLERAIRYIIAERKP